MRSLADLFAAAQAARGRAYAPYSKFPVGAVIETADGRRYAGANVENASYGLTMCAERTAVTAAILDGARDIVAVAVAGPAGVLCAPCGACRQVLAEFGSPTTRVAYGTAGGFAETTLGALLPDAFDSAALENGTRGSRLIDRTYTTEAIVLRARNLGEADKIFTLFTRSHGKISAVGKGVRRPKSALAGRLELLAETTMTLHRGRNLDVIAQAQTLRSYWSQFAEPDALAAASMVAELVDMFCEPELPLDDIYTLLVNAAAAIAAAPAPAALLPRFQLRLLDALGLAPPADVCVRCGRPLEDDGAWVDVESGGLGCERCYGTRGNARAFDAADVANFRALGAPRTGGVRATADANPKVARAVDDIVTYHLGKRPKSRAFLDAFTP